MNNQTLSVILGFSVLMGCSGSIPDLGVNNGALLPCPQTPNCVSSQAAGEDHYIEPFHYNGTQQEARNRLLRIIKSEKLTKIQETRENYIRAEFTSALFRFVDDVEFYFPEKQNKESVIHIRSASRVGYSDLGVNRERVELIRSKFDR